MGSDGLARDRYSWEIEFTQRNRGDGAWYAWEIAIGVGWRLTAWALTKTNTQQLGRALVDDAYVKVAPDRFDPVVAAMSVAVVEQAFAQDSHPNEVTLAGVRAQLANLPVSRHHKPFCFDEEDLRALLVAASDTDLQGWMDLAEGILFAHAQDHLDSIPDSATPSGAYELTAADRLPHCPNHGGSAALLSAEPRR